MCIYIYTFFAENFSFMYREGYKLRFQLSQENPDSWTPNTWLPLEPKGRRVALGNFTGNYNTW